MSVVTHILRVDDLFVIRMLRGWTPEWWNNQQLLRCDVSETKNPARRETKWNA